MKNNRHTQARTHSYSIIDISDVCIDTYIICVGSYISNYAVSYNICSEPEDTVNFQ